MTRHPTGIEAGLLQELAQVRGVLEDFQARITAAAREGRRPDLRLTKEEADALADILGLPRVP